MNSVQRRVILRLPGFKRPYSKVLAEADQIGVQILNVDRWLRFDILLALLAFKVYRGHCELLLIKQIARREVALVSSVEHGPDALPGVLILGALDHCDCFGCLREDRVQVAVPFAAFIDRWAFLAHRTHLFILRK